MRRELTEQQLAAAGLSDDFDNDFEILAPDSFRDLLGDEARKWKIREPFSGNGHTPLDPVSRYALVELAWYYDPARIEEIPHWDAKALRKMRTPLVGFSHYRVNARTMPLLFEMAWYQESLLHHE